MVSGGTAHVPSDLRYLLDAPAEGAGTSPAFPAAEEDAPPILLYVVFCLYGCGGTGDSDDVVQSNTNAETAPNVETEASSEAEDASQASTESNLLDSYFTVNDSETVGRVK